MRRKNCRLDDYRYRSDKGARDSQRAHKMLDFVLNLFLEHKIITHCLSAEDNGQLDKDGADRLIYLPSGLAIPLQVKYTGKNLEERIKKIISDHLEAHPHLKYIFIMTPEIVPKSETDTEGLYKMGEALSRVLFPKIS